MLKNADVLPWKRNYVGGTGYIDRIPEEVVAHDQVYKGVDHIKRPFIAFRDDDGILCTLFQRYQQTSDATPSMWVGIPQESKLFRGCARISDDFKKFEALLHKHATSVVASGKATTSKE